MLDPIHHRVDVGVVLVLMLDNEGLPAFQLQVLQKLLHHLETLFLQGLVLLRKADAQVVDRLLDAAAKGGCVPHLLGDPLRVLLEGVSSFDAAHPGLPFRRVASRRVASRREVVGQAGEVGSGSGFSDHIVSIS